MSHRQGGPSDIMISDVSPKQAQFSGKVKSFLLRLPETLFEKFKKEAIERNISLNALFLEKLEGKSKRKKG